MIPFPEYARIKNNYCLAYFGYSNEYLVQMRQIRPLLERRFPGLSIHLCGKDDFVHLLGRDRVVKLSEIKIRKKDFAHICELSYAARHPVEQLLEDSGITDWTVCREVAETTSLAVIVTKGFHPTKSLEQRTIDHLARIAGSSGYDVQIGGDASTAGWVLGVESVDVFEAAGAGRKTTLVPTGAGIQLYKRMFPLGEIFQIP
jgi:hypothetical protein